MKKNEEIKIVNDDIVNALKNIANVIKDYQDTIQKKLSVITEITQPLLNIEFPKITLPEIDYEEIRSVTKNNSKYGWTLTGEIGLGEYLNRDLINVSKKEIDEYFFNIYTAKNEISGKSFYEVTKENILRYISKKWIPLIKDCFTCYELKIYKVAIPNLIMIIEGELSEIANSHKYGLGLIKEWKEEVYTEDDKFDAIFIYSMINFLQYSLFLRHDFDSNRLEILNRNWIMHGRDDPAFWDEVDYLRLINVLSSFQTFKEFYKN